MAMVLAKATMKKATVRKATVRKATVKKATARKAMAKRRAKRKDGCFLCQNSNQFSLMFGLGCPSIGSWWYSIQNSGANVDVCHLCILYTYVMYHHVSYLHDSTCRTLWVMPHMVVFILQEGTSQVARHQLCRQAVDRAREGGL